MKKRGLFFNRNLQVIFCVTLIAVMEVSCIAPVLPKIADALSITPHRANMLIVVFTMPGIFLAPFFGVAADRFGRKKVLVPALLLFGICGTAAGFTREYSTILILRFFQGAGSASIGSLNQTVIGDIFDGEERITAMGYNSSVLNVGTMLYPSIGGAVAMIGWYYPFFLAALAFPVSLLVIFVLDFNDPERNGKLGEYLKGAFRLVRDRHILFLYGGTLAAFILLYGIILAFFPYYMRDHFASTPVKIGLVMSVLSVGSIIGAFNLGRLAGIFSPKSLLVSAFVIYAFTLALAPFMPGVFSFIVPVVLYGFANGILIPNIQTQIAVYASSENRGAFMSMNSSILKLGQTAGPLLSGIILAGPGENVLFAAGVIFSLLSALLAAHGVRDSGNFDQG